MVIFHLVLPLFLLAMAGWALAKTGWLLPEGWQTGVNALTAKVLLPCVLFTGMYQHGLPKTHAWALLLSFYLPLVIVFWGVYLLMRRHPERAQLCFAGAFSNLVFIGIPVLAHVFGEQALQYAFPIIAFHSMILFSMYYLCDSLVVPQSDHHKLIASLVKAVKNPIVLSLMAGLALNILHVPLPKALLDTTQMGARAALPTALIVLGASLAGITLQGKRLMLLVVASKLIVLPALVLVFSHYVFHLPLAVSSVLVVMASCPVGINVYVVVRGNGRNVTTVSSAILLSCWMSLLAWPFWLWALQQLP